MRVEILESAHEDLVIGHWFYERQEAGLGDYFTDSLYAEIESLQLYAGIHPRQHGFFRLLARRFPYAVYYLIENQAARIYAVVDTRRDPSWIVLRLAMGG